MKRCPECNRTYSDESISFCLADGSLLSAPYQSSKQEPPPTEILPAPVPVPPTQSSKSAVPTMTSLPGANKYFPGNETDGQSPTKARPLVWCAIALGVVALIVGVTLILRYGFVNRNEAAVAASPPITPDGQSTLSSSTASPDAPGTSAQSPKPGATISSNVPSSSPVPSETRKSSVVDADPVLFPPKSRGTDSTAANAGVTPTPSPQATDYDRIYRGSEVDQKARLLSKPTPGYTSEARTNQIVGVVVLRAVFSSSGQVTNISTIRGLPHGLTARAIEAARQIKFVPATKNGSPVSMWMQLEYVFNLY